MARRPELRRLEPGDVPAAQALVASFGWPHRERDLAFMLALGEGVAAPGPAALVGTAVCWRFGPDWATMGLIAVGAAQQGQGIGRRMMHALMDKLPKRRIALHATRAGMALCAKLGFEPTGTTIQYQGPAAQPGLWPLAEGTRLRPAGPADLAAVASLDQDACGMNRTMLLEPLLALPGGVVLDGPAGPVGFALRRGFGLGQVIGPVVAEEPDAARAMIAHLLGQRSGQFVRLDIAKESGIGAWLAGLGLEEAGTVIRMVRCGDVPGGGRARTFGLAGQAWG